MTTIINGSSDINLDFSTGGRITGDFSNATQANRVLFQSTTANGNTSVQCVPNGTATTSGFGAFNSSDPANAGRWYINATSSLVNMSADKTGTGSYLPMTFNTGGSETLRLSETSKAVILSGGSTSANGTGITFPATQSASSNANTLDDYEEGTWTPVAVTGGLSSAEGVYVKIGRTVYVNGRVNFSSLPNSTSVSFSGLPFTAGAGVTYYSGGGREDISQGFSMITQVNNGNSTIGLNYYDASNFQTRGFTGFNFFCWYIAA